jgi:vancomycin permeability regulator SanA
MLIKLLKYFNFTILAIIIIIIITNIIIVTSTTNNILDKNNINDLKDIDCILILGAGIRGNNPSPMLEDRLLEGISLYQNKVSPKILVSGDHMGKYYDEVNVMKDFLVGHKIPSQDVFMDHAGISTYDSIYRAKHIFKAKKIIIVTQKYHLHRALYIAENLGLESYGIASNPRQYRNQLIREIREYLARTKDFFKTLLKIKSTYLGEEISIKGNGDITNDKIDDNN